MIEPLDLGPTALREQVGLESAQTERPHHPDGMRGEVSPAVLDMMRDHREKGVLTGEWLDQMRGSELGVIGYGVGPADFEFHPDASSSGGLPEENISLRSVAEDGFDAGRHDTGFRHAFPSGGAMLDEGVLKLTGEAGHVRKLCPAPGTAASDDLDRPRELAECGRGRWPSLSASCWALRIRQKLLCHGELAGQINAGVEAGIDQL
jgi:hypothetical protein